MLAQLFKPLGYLFIKHPHKWVVDWLYPCIAATLTIIAVCGMSDISAFSKPGGGISLILSFIQSLPGFYIAALAAIATFGRLDIDDILPEPTPKVVIKLRGTSNIVELTRRRFLAMLFAFLTAESILLTIFSIFLVSFGENIYSIKAFNAGYYCLIAFCFAFMIGFYQMVLATFWGLYYLGYKLQE